MDLTPRTLLEQLDLQEFEAEKALLEIRFRKRIAERRGEVALSDMPHTEAAKRLGVTPITIRRMIEDGRLRGTQESARKWTVTLESIIEYEKQQE